MHVRAAPLLERRMTLARHEHEQLQGVVKLHPGQLGGATRRLRATGAGAAQCRLTAS
jgi:hypothetical protein